MDEHFFYQITCLLLRKEGEGYIPPGTLHIYELLPSFEQERIHKPNRLYSTARKYSHSSLQDSNTYNNIAIH